MRSFVSNVDIALKRIMAGGLVADQESPTLEFKEDNKSYGDMEKIILRAAVCFANSAGGTVVVGVKDKERGISAITGTNIDPNALKQRIYELSRPHLNVNVHRHHQYTNVILIEVPQSAEIHSDPEGRAYQRINRQCSPMTPDQQARLREERRGIDWSAKSSGRSVADVSPEAISGAKSILSKFNDGRRDLANLGTEDLLSALGALAPNSELNLAGELMFCTSSANVDTAILYQFRSTPGGEPKMVQRFPPPLLISFLRSMEIIAARQTSTPLTMSNGQQIVIEDFPSLAVREAISNALCHRDYQLAGPVVIEHSPEVFIVTSPGPLVSGVTIANIITTTSRPRNPALAKIARILGLAEELGRGIDRMYREMIRSGRQVPRIDAEFDKVKVTLVGGAPDTQIAKFIATIPEEERDDTDTMLTIYHMCSSRTINALGCAAWLQKTPEEAEAVLGRLASDSVNLLERTRATVGRSRPTYRLRGDALKGLGTAVLYHRRTTDEIDRKVIAHIQEYGKITNRTLQNFFDVHVFKARDIISDLVRRDILVRVSMQTRGPKVEWGPGQKFPATKPVKKVARDDEEQAQLKLDYPVKKAKKNPPDPGSK